MKNKVCSKCGIKKPLSEFYKDSKMKDGVFASCKKCDGKREGIINQRNRERNSQVNLINKTKTKICAKCRKARFISEFSKDNCTKDGHTCYCKVCEAEKRKINVVRYKIKNGNKDYDKEELVWCGWCREKKTSRLFGKDRSSSTGYTYLCKSCVLIKERKRHYGITTESINALIKHQDNKCPICGNMLGGKFCVDHDHKSGVVRGLLCDNCNKGLGNLKDNTGILRAAILYLEK